MLSADILVTRTPGIHLTDFGRRQAEAVAERLAGETVHAIYASPMERAQETAAPLAKSKKLPVQTLPGINEFDFGDWTNREQTSLREDAEWKKFNQFRSGTRPPGGESMHQVQARFVASMTEVRDRHPGQTVALVSHADPLRTAIMHFMGMPLDFCHRIEISLASITRLELGADWVRLVGINEVPLPLGGP